MAKKNILPKNITTLIETIRNEILTGKRNIENTILNEKTKTYWNIGKHLYNHLRENESDSTYGDYLFTTLEEALNIHKRTLYRAADIFYDKTEKNPFKVAEKGAFLNQQLLDAGLVVTYRYV